MMENDQNEVCTSSLWVAGQVVYAVSIFVVFCAVSLHLGSKEYRATMSPQIKRALFVAAQCSAVAVTCFGQFPALAALMAGALTQQCGTEPYWCMAYHAMKRLGSGSRRQQRHGLSRHEVEQDLLKILLAVGVLIHHLSIIVLPLFAPPCLSRDTVQPYLPLFLSAIVGLGCWAGLSDNALIRALTDFLAIALYWFFVSCSWVPKTSSDLPWLYAWTIFATVGDLLIGMQLLVWHVRVQRPKLRLHKQKQQEVNKAKRQSQQRTQHSLQHHQRRYSVRWAKKHHYYIRKYYNDSSDCYGDSAGSELYGNWHASSSTLTLPMAVAEEDPSCNSSSNSSSSDDDNDDNKDAFLSVPRPMAMTWADGKADDVVDLESTTNPPVSEFMQPKMTASLRSS